ncbi:Calmodulin-like protein 11 [Durusdinium trenchii]|uniref:Calmodulin-like protein 11 n=1 Tax=Durusdinium trenchii TaxID=1381693 RepID=A0ABP0PKW6_9DINO
MAGISVAKKVRDARDRHKEEERAQREKRLDELFTELDSSGDGVLEAAEVKILLQGLADGKEPAEEELTFIMRTIGHKNKEKITRAQLTQAIESWTLYLQEFGSDDSAGKVLFEKYDKSKTGKLDHEELKSLLIDLAGRDVSQEDVDWIMAKADVLGDGMIAKIELSQAIALWLQRLASDAEAQASRTTTSSSSRACAIL